MTLSILLAEDEDQLARVYTAALEHKGYQVVRVSNGQEAIDQSKEQVFDVMILDIMMPVKNGLEALAEIRSSGDKTHVVMLTAMSGLDDKVTGLETGADDYLTKPISLKELLARMASLERRLDSFTDKVLNLGNIILNTSQQELATSNTIRLSNKESQLMAFFMLNHGKELRTKDIFQHLWAKDKDPEIDEGYVYIYVSYLRQKLKAIGANLEIIGDENQSYHLIIREEVE